MSTVRVIAGLGNPGQRYDGTRHNIGFVALDKLAAVHAASWKPDKRFCAQTASIVIAGQPVLLLKPETFMNASGKAIGNVCRYFKWHPDSVLVVVDEFQLSLGRTKLSLKGSAGGHNGVADIIQRMGPNFWRYRIGIAPAEPSPMSMTDFVLGKFTPDETKSLAGCWDKILGELDSLVRDGPQSAINTINQRIQKNEPSNQTEI